MKRKTLVLLLVATLLPAPSDAKSYSSGGRSYSSSRSSSSFSRSPSSSSRSSGSGKSYTSGSGRTYSSPSSSGSSSSRTYSSGSSGSKSFSSSSAKSSSASSSSSARKSSEPSSIGSRFSFDTAAARAQKEAASKRDFSEWKQSKSQDSARRSFSDSDSAPPILPRSLDGSRSYSGSSRSRPLFTPDSDAYRTRRIRMERQYAPYYTRPMVLYHDSYSSFFWWWLLDRTLDERAHWAYHHRADMDGARYQALIATDTNLESRVRQLEAQNTPVNSKYVPDGMERDLMYTDQSVHRAYVTRPTTSGRVLFWLIMIPTAIGVSWFMIWFVFYKRWPVARP